MTIPATTFVPGFHCRIWGLESKGAAAAVVVVVEDEDYASCEIKKNRKYYPPPSSIAVYLIIWLFFNGEGRESFFFSFPRSEG